MTRIAVLLALVACGGGELAIDSGDGLDSAADTSGDSDSAVDSATDSEDTSSVRDVCTRWTADRAGLTEGTWSGSVSTCDPGDISADGRAAALRSFNLYRWLADLPEVATDPSRDEAAQACALMMDANNALSHAPPQSWDCYTSLGAAGAAQSNISSGRGTSSVDLYMVDPGNSTTLGHRRWILSNSAGPIGLGSTSERSCMHILSGSGNAGKRWTAWPPPDGVPLQALRPPTVGWTNVDQTGWSVQSDAVDVRNAQVTITRDGQDLPVSVTNLVGGYGSAYAIAMVPQGWTTSAGTYTVTVAASAETFSYDVDVVDCD